MSKFWKPLSPATKETLKEAAGITAVATAVIGLLGLAGYAAANAPVEEVTTTRRRVLRDRRTGRVISDRVEVIDEDDLDTDLDDFTEDSIDLIEKARDKAAFHSWSCKCGICKVAAMNGWRGRRTG